MDDKTQDKLTPHRGDQHQPTATNRDSNASDQGISKEESHGTSRERRFFLKQAGAFSAGLVGGPVLLQGCGGGGVQAAVPAPSTDALPPAAGRRPVIQFNDTASSHLLSIDLRSEANLLALNNIYGAGTYTPSGTLGFDSHRGVQAADELSGLVIDLSKILGTDVRRGLAGEGQLTVELESNRIADPWLINEYGDRYPASRTDPGLLPASMGLPPFAQLRSIWRMVAEDGVGGPSVQGPAPESPSGLNTRANNLSVRLRDTSAQDMQIGIHSAAHSEFTAVTTAWWASNSFTVYADGVPEFLAGPLAVGAHGVQVQETAYTMVDIQASSAPKQQLHLFFGRSGVYVRRLILGMRAPEFPLHPLFRACASYGDSFTHRGGYANGRSPSNDIWDADNHYYFMRALAQYGYRMGWCWDNSLGGASFLKTAPRSLWNNGGRSDLESLKNINPSYVMMTASHNDAGYVGQGGQPETAEYQRRLSTIKADFLEHVGVILTGRSPSWQKVSLPGDAQIGIISAPVSPIGPGWGESQAQAQRDLNNFVLRTVSEWVRSNLGEMYANRIATFDAAALFGPQQLVKYNPLFERNGTGVHPNWWGAQLMNYAWWQCALKLINN